MMHIEMVTVDARDPQALATWWARQIDGTLRDITDAFIMVVPSGGGPNLGFQRVDEPTPGKNRLHLDLAATDRDLEVERLLAEGALEVARHEDEGFSWVVLADPEGNQFCVAQRS